MTGENVQTHRWGIPMARMVVSLTEYKVIKSPQNPLVCKQNKISSQFLWEKEKILKLVERRDRKGHSCRVYQKSESLRSTS